MRTSEEDAKMFTTDLYLGIFLILCGFALSLFNLRRVVRGSTTFSSVLLSENIILMCIGIAFISRAVYSINPVNVEVYDMEERTAELENYANNSTSNCGFLSLLLGYGPLVVSMVNSFLSLIIDNYMHYKMLGGIKEKSDENVVRELNDDGDIENKETCGDLRNFWKRYFSPITIAAQWIVPILVAISMYPMGVKEISMSQARSMDESCMAMLDLTNNDCDNITHMELNSLDLPKYFQSPVKFFEAHESYQAMSNETTEINSVLSSVLNIINNFNNHSNFNFTAVKAARRPKSNINCMKMCYTDNKILLLYMFVLAFVSYFIPITISTILLMKIHVMDVQKPITKSITRELLYNILFWTPVMFDTFLSLVFCAYSMHGVRTSMFNVVANIYQAVKNFMNTKYFKENVIVPV